ncbi:MAG: hypothetical protein M1158_04365 [Candidatus Marsarchaeota archaeon]|nr:hypothetical protein [Candidatus Marsarchaeota archaeon]
MRADARALLGIMGSGAAALPSFAAALLLAYLGIMVPAIAVIAVFGFAWNASRTRANKARASADSMALGLARRLAERLRRGKPLLGSLERSMVPGERRYDGLRAALFRYKGSGDASAIASLDAMGSDKLRRLFELMARLLPSSASPLNPIEALASDLEHEESYRMRGIGLASNYSSVLRMGTAVFFPLFAGISMNVMAFAHASLGGTSINPAQLFAIFTAYAVLANYAGTMRGPGKITARAASTAFFGAVAVIVMRVVSTLSLAI